MNSAFARPLVVAPMGRTGRLVIVLCLCAAVLGGSGAAAQGDDISTLAVGCGNRTTIADFLLGGLDGVMASESDSSAAGGQLRLQATASELFLEPVLGPDWEVTRGPVPTVAGGVLDGQTYTAGLPVASAAELTASYGAGVACEVRALLQPGSNFSSVGFFSGTATTEQWAYFSTFGTGTDSVPVIHTSVRGAGGSIVGVPTTVTLDEWHDFRIVWQPGVLEFYVDGALVDTRTGVDITLPQRFGYYKSG
ncbi:MAG: family 16 glycosylhydrolase, partial [Krumholzibacteria bacterium]|nr:family 16 glycosylhydrolase [Candidatus Krumholzibacteria bacterium]